MEQAQSPRPQSTPASAIAPRANNRKSVPRFLLSGALDQEQQWRARLYFTLRGWLRYPVGMNTAHHTHSLGLGVEGRML